mmetsp:Transcript_29909/g.81044  ORF Transcript_29909/g.81044 Transcript_29909/m.81044 type:complete len:247 (+) Transcript_29909:911-1651(+)
MMRSTLSNIALCLGMHRSELRRRMPQISKPTPQRSSICHCEPPCEAWVLGPSMPSPFGSTPPMAKRMACTVTKERLRPATSFSDSFVSSSQTCSYSSISPSSLFEMWLRIRWYPWYMTKRPHQPTGTAMRQVRGLALRMLCCKAPQALMAEKPATCAKSTARLFTLTSTTSIFGAAPPHISLMAPDVMAKITCISVSHQTSWPMSTATSQASLPPAMMYSSTRPLNPWNKSTAQKMEMVWLITRQE